MLGEVTDVVWAPIAALALRSLFDSSNVVLALEFVEEILPFTDVLPLATLCWVVETYYGDSNVARALRIGRYGKEGVVIDVTTDDAEDAPAGRDLLGNGTKREEDGPPKWR